MDPQKLREATRPEHEATEALMPLMGDGLSRSTYIETLQTLEPLVASWEVWAAAWAPADVAAMLPTRRRSQWIAADLEALGATGKQGGEEIAGGVKWEDVVVAPGAADGPVTDEGFAASFLGAMYVMEGSTLGGRFLARHVTKALGLAPGMGVSYFQGHGEATGAMWREVTGRITAVPEVLSPVVTGTARRAFRAFGDALRAAAVAPGLEPGSEKAMTPTKRMAS